MRQDISTAMARMTPEHRERTQKSIDKMREEYQIYLYKWGLRSEEHKKRSLKSVGVTIDKKYLIDPEIEKQCKGKNLVYFDDMIDSIMIKLKKLRHNPLDVNEISFQRWIYYQWVFINEWYPSELYTLNTMHKKWGNGIFNY